MLRKFKVFVALIAAAALTTVFLPATSSAAATAVPSEQATALESGPSIIPLTEGSTIDLGTTGSVDGHTLLVELVNPTTGQHIVAPSEGGVSPQVTVGAGWYLYVYLNQGDVTWLLGLGFAAASAALCTILAPTLAGAIACAAVAYIIWSIVTSYQKPAPGQCLEIRINWWGTLSGVSYVNRNC